MSDLELTFKDYQHALKLIEETNFDAAPKAKFLYHVVFELTDEARTLFRTTDNISMSLLSILAKFASMPSYTANVDTINQYNRKKKYQTKIEYKDININFYDDNAGITRSLLEAYYKYYFKEATKDSYDKINSRDKFSLILPSYGLDNGRTKPFFEYIKIFQLSKNKWFCYTLVNPIITQWGHDELSYAEGGGTTENKITVGYEAVLYTNGAIEDNGDPRDFADYYYDKQPGVLKDKAPTGREELKPSLAPATLASVFQENPPPALAQTFTETRPNPFSILEEFIPKTPGSTVLETASTTAINTPRYDAAQLKNIVSTNPDMLAALTNQALATGSYSSEWNSSNFSEFALLDPATKNSIQQDIINQIGNNVKLQQLASRVVNTSENTIV